MVNIKELSTNDLKAMAYDSIAQIERAQQNLQLINQELATRPDAQPQAVQVAPAPANRQQRRAVEAQGRKNKSSK